MKKSYFIDPMPPAADLLRHVVTENYLRTTIANAIKAGNFLVANAYTRLLVILLDSKANIII